MPPDNHKKADCGLQNRQGDITPPQDPPLTVQAKKEPAVSISQVPTDVLLRGLEVRVTDKRRAIKTWLDSDSYYPGTTRISATDLYTAYAQWVASNPSIAGRLPMSIEKWGIEVRKYLRAGRSSRGIHYYISRNPTPTIPDDMVPKFDNLLRPRPRRR